MSLASNASKLVNNKYFLYLMVFLAATNVLGYMVTNKWNAIIFFVLIGLLTFQFSKNMAVVLLAALVATNFLVASKMVREGLTNNDTTTSATTSSDDKNADTVDKVSAQDPSLGKPAQALKDTKKVEAAKDALNAKKAANASTTDSSEPVAANKDSNNPTLNNGVDSSKVEGFRRKSGTKASTKESYIDHAATIEEAYTSLDNILGSDGINKLTQDTQRLMAQQQKLFNTMNQMTPVVKDAMSMMKGLDLKGISGLLGKSQPASV